MRIRAILTALAVVLSGMTVLSACARISPRAGLASPTASPSPTSTPSSSPSPSTVTSTSPPASPIASGVQGCTLPYVKPASLGSGSAPFSGGFVNVTQGKWTADPAGQINQTGDLLVTTAKPVLTGSGFGSDDSVSYDVAVKRWLPVRRAQVRGDGLAYAYAEPFKASARDAQNSATRIHVVSLVDGTDRVIYSGSPRAVLAFQPEGIYIAAIRYSSGDSSALGTWRIDPATGFTTQLANGAGFRMIDHRVAWTDYSAIMPSRLDRIDVSTGASQTWVDIHGQGWIWFVGLDASGNPLVDVSQGSSNSWRLFVYTASQTRSVIADVNVHQEGITDSHGTWLAGSDGIYLLQPGTKLVKVSDVTDGNIAGACIQ